MELTASVVIENLSIGLPKKMQYDGKKELETGICKDAVEEVFLSKDGFRGDGVADLKHHGGPDRAVCIYPAEHYAFWAERFQQALPQSAFGENITATNMLEKDVHIGDIFSIGEALIQVTQGRIPCDTISKRTGLPHLLAGIVETGFTGFLCRVIQEGTVHKNDVIKLVTAHPQKISVLYANKVYFHEPKNIEAMERILAVPELATVWQEKLKKRLKR